MEDYNFESGYIQTSVDNASKITGEQLTNLKELAEKCYINFNENPVIEGEITSREHNVKDSLGEIISDLPNNDQFTKSGLLYLTLDEWKRIKKIEGLEIDEQIGAVFPIRPSVAYIISTYYKKIDISQNRNIITVKGKLHDSILNYFRKPLGLSHRYSNLLYKFKNPKNLKVRCTELLEKGVVLPEPKDGVLSFRIAKDDQFDLSFEAQRLSQV